jgi:hypothetical protein
MFDVRGREMNILELLQEQHIEFVDIGVIHMPRHERRKFRFQSFNVNLRMKHQVSIQKIASPPVVKLFFFRRDCCH